MVARRLAVGALRVSVTLLASLAAADYLETSIFPSSDVCSSDAGAPRIVIAYTGTNFGCATEFGGGSTSTLCYNATFANTSNYASSTNCTGPSSTWQLVPVVSTPGCQTNVAGSGASRLQECVSTAAPYAAVGAAYAAVYAAPTDGSNSTPASTCTAPVATYIVDLVSLAAGTCYPFLFPDAPPASLTFACGAATTSLTQYNTSTACAGTVSQSWSDAPFGTCTMISESTYSSATCTGGGGGGGGDGGSSALSGGAVAGIVIAVFVVIGLAVGAYFYLGAGAAACSLGALLGSLGLGGGKGVSTKKGKRVSAARATRIVAHNNPVNSAI